MGVGDRLGAAVSGERSLLRVARVERDESRTGHGGRGAEVGGGRSQAGQPGRRMLASGREGVCVLARLKKPVTKNRWALPSPPPSRTLLCAASMNAHTILAGGDDSEKFDFL